MDDFRDDVKIISSRRLTIPNTLSFLFEPGWSRRAGVIPYTIEDGKYILLLGESKYNEKLTDLGGGCKQIESPIICAQRELKEESRETLDFNLKDVTHIVVTGNKGPHQVIFLVHFPKIGNEEYLFFESLKNEKLNKKGYNEINELEWLVYDDVMTYSRRDLENSLNSLLDVLLF